MIIWLCRDDPDPAALAPFQRYAPVHVVRTPGHRRTTGLLDWADTTLATIRTLLPDPPPHTQIPDPAPLSDAPPAQDADEAAPAAPAAAAVCADRASARFGWRLAQARPDLPVLANPRLALAVLDHLRTTGTPTTPATIRALLDPGAPIPPAPPAYFTDTRCRPPLTVILTTAAGIADTPAATWRRRGHDVVTITPTSHPPTFTIAGDHTVHLRPTLEPAPGSGVRTRLRDHFNRRLRRVAPPRGPDPVTLAAAPAAIALRPQVLQIADAGALAAGRAVARQLRRLGHEVTVVEPGAAPPGAASASARTAPAPADAELGPRVVIGAANSAGQATAWAHALTRDGIPARSLELRGSENPFHHAADRVYPLMSVFGVDRRLQLLARELLPARALILESLRPIWAPPGFAEHPALAEAQALTAAGKAVGLLFHGSDLRRPDTHITTHARSPFADPANRELTDALRAHTDRTREALARWDGPVMVSTPDLLAHHDGATWVPVVVDTDRFRPAPRPPHPGAPLVVHLPSRSALKGSAIIDPVLERLAEAGVIRYRRYTGIPHEEVPAILAGADILVDQLGMGILGVAALEAMAAGVVVVTDPGPEAATAYGEPLPVAVIDADTIEPVMRHLAADAEARARLAAAARPFVQRHHTGARSAAAIRAAMGW